MEDYPQENKQDISKKFIKGGIASIPIPILSGIAAEIFDMVVMPSVSKRREEWLESLGKAFQELESKIDGFSIESLQGNEAFVSMLLQISHVAMRTHQEEKLKMLQNAVLNAAMPDAPDESEQQVFINIAAEFTIWHIKVLQLFTQGKMPTLDLQSKNWKKDSALDETWSTVCSKYPAIEPYFELFLTIIEDLSAKSLISNTHPEPYMTSEITSRPEQTRLAKRFLAFLKSPIED